MNTFFPILTTFVRSLNVHDIFVERRVILDQLAEYVQGNRRESRRVNLNFICTHNSRRSHLSQVWAQTMAAHTGVSDVHCYSGGTEATALFPVVVETLRSTGFEIGKVSDGQNPVYAIKFGENSPPVIGFSKKFDASFNPASEFAAVMTCSHADENCPVISGAERRIPVMYEDPKVSDDTPQQKAVYARRSREIATEMLYVFSKIE